MEHAQPSIFEDFGNESFDDAFLDGAETRRPTVPLVTSPVTP
ncbi:hypothetical protein [Frondihabitans peucedani]